VPAGLPGAGARVAERGDEAAYRVIEPDSALLDQHQHRRGHDGLGHRGDAEQVVLLHRTLSRQVRQALRLHVDDPSLARHQRDRAGHLSGGHQLIDECTDPLQSRRRDAL